MPSTCSEGVTVIESEGRPGSTSVPRTPDYQRIMADLRRRIAAGEWKPGEQLPTRQKLAEEYEVSLQPVVAAVTRLQIEGVLEGQQGKGIYVANPTAD